jgi:hypothetical protein
MICIVPTAELQWAIEPSPNFPVNDLDVISDGQNVGASVPLVLGRESYPWEDRERGNRERERERSRLLRHSMLELSSSLAKLLIY